MEKEWGEIAYDAYREASGGKSLVSGAPIPQWDDMAPEIRAAWNEAGHAVKERCIFILAGVEERPLELDD